MSEAQFKIFKKQIFQLIIAPLIIVFIIQFGSGLYFAGKIVNRVEMLEKCSNNFDKKIDKIYDQLMKK